MSTASTSATSNAVIWFLSIVVCAVVGFLILGPRPEGLAGGVDVSFLPTVNASINACTVLLLVGGFVSIKAGRKEMHKRFMLGAFGMSTLFLTTYVVYHWFSEGPTLYTGAFKPLYLVILFSHIVLAAVILPMALHTVHRAWTGSFERHKKLARPTFWTWLYVSITGVVIYLMLHL